MKIQGKSLACISEIFLSGFRTILSNTFRPTSIAYMARPARQRSLLLIGILMTACLPTWAATLTVINTSDGGTGSLRDAIATANSDNNGDIISFDPKVVGTITLTTGTLTISGNMTINGPGASLLTVSGNNLFTVFTVNAGANAAISGLTIANGKSSNLGSYYYRGGGVHNQGTLNLSGVTVSGNTAIGGGGATGGGGGGIANYNNATMVIKDSTISGNSADEWGGGISNSNGSTLSISNSTIAGNKTLGSTNFGGGGIYNNGTAFLSVTNSTITGNSATSDAGGIVNNNTTNNAATVANSVVAGNTNVNTGLDSALCGGSAGCTQSGNNLSGALTPPLAPLAWNGGLTQTMMPLWGQTGILGVGIYQSGEEGMDQRGFRRSQAGAIDLGAVQTNYIVVTNTNNGPNSSSNCGSTAGSACSLYDAITLANSSYSMGVDIVFNITGTISQQGLVLPNITGTLNLDGPGANQLTIDGGGPGVSAASVFVVTGTNVNISGITVTGGNAQKGGGISSSGGILSVNNCSFSGNSAGNSGGGIDEEGTALLVTGSTFSGNTAGSGGGIFGQNATLIVTNNTFFQNTATSGGGIYSSSAPLLVTNSTLSGNSATNNGGIYSNNFEVTVANSIVSGNTSGADITSGYTDAGGNKISDATATLSGLQYNGTGATTQTLIPLPGSSAICAGQVLLISPLLTTDQRGFPRLNTTYSGYSTTTSCLDAGAVQTNYSDVKFVDNPTDSAVNQPLSTTPTVEVLETNALTSTKNPVNGVPVTLTFYGNGTAVGLTATTAGGLASFPDIKVDTAGTGDYFKASILAPPTIPSDQSNNFDVRAASQIAVVAGSNQSTTIGTAFPTPLEVVVTDASGNPVRGAAVNFSAPSSGNPSATLSTPAATNSSGITSVSATANNISNGATGYAVTASVTGASTSATFILQNTQAIPTLSGPASAPSFVYGSGGNISVTVTASGTGLPTPTGSVSYVIDGGMAQTATISSSLATISVPATVSAGNHSIAVNYSGDGNYSAGTALTVNFTVTPATLAVTANNASRTYGAANPTFSGTATGALNGDTFTENFSTTAIASSSVGTYAIVPSVSGSAVANYTVTISNGTLTVTSATLTVTANNASRAYGAANPTFSGTVTGALNGDIFTESFSTTATASSSVGTYAIVPSVSGSAVANYTVTVNNGTLTVTSATLTVTANNASRTYGTANPTFSGTVTGALNGDTFTENFSTTAIASSSVGTYAIVPSVSGSAVANYTVTVNNGTLTVTPATLVVTANNASRAYGAANPTFSGTVTGALNGDTFTESFSTTAIASSSVGTYAIVPSVSGSAVANYTVTVSNGTLTVTSATLTVTANNASRAYGAANPTFSGTVTGALNGDTFTESFSTAATASSNVGTYAIVPAVSGSALGKYAQVVTNGTLTITKAATTVLLAVGSAQATPGQTSTLVATVIPATSGSPTGTVSFYDNGSTLALCTSTLNGTAGSDTATCTTSLAAGATNALTAVYNGDSNFTGSSSAASPGTTVTVQPLDFTMVIAGSSIATVVPGASISYALTLTPTYGTYAGPINFTVSGLPSGATATFSPSSIAATGGKQTVILTVRTASTTSSNQAPLLGRRAASLALCLLLLPLAGTARMRRGGKQMRRLLGLSLLLAGISGSATLSGCGLSNNTFVQIKSYQVTITASEGTLQHSTSVVLQIQ